MICGKMALWPLLVFCYCQMTLARRLPVTTTATTTTTASSPTLLSALTMQQHRITETTTGPQGSSSATTSSRALQRQTVVGSDSPSSSPSTKAGIPGTPTTNSSNVTLSPTPSLTVASLKPALPSPTERPSNSTSRNTTAPVAPTSKPVQPTPKPVQPTPKPVQPTSKPVQPTESPTRTTLAPTFSPTTSFPSDTPSVNPSHVPSATPSTSPSTSPPTITPTIRTAVPSASPSSIPSTSPSSAPSAIPSSAPTGQPTFAPTNILNKTEVRGQVILVLSPVSETMNNGTLQVFVTAVTSFFNASLASSNSTIEILNVTSLQQILLQNTTTTTTTRRQLVVTAKDSSVLVQLQVVGQTIASGKTAALPDLNQTLSQLVKTQGPALISTLKSTKNAYFGTVQSVAAVPSIPAPTPPPSAPTPSPNAITPTTLPTTKKKGLGTGVIIGIAVAGALLLIIIAAFLLIRRRINSTLNRNTSDNLTFASMPTTVGAANEEGRRKSPSNHNSNFTSMPAQPAAQAAALQGYESSSTSSYQQQQQQQQQTAAAAAAAASRQRRTNTGAASQSSMADTHSDYGSELMGTDNQSDRGDTAAGDTMSYTYSLDAGLTDTFEGTSTISGTASSSHHAPVPTSIPHITKSRDENDMDDDDDDLELELGSVASSTLVGAAGGNARVAEQYITRECWAPPGKLGIVIDTTLEGPVVHKVNAGSPLEGMVWPGDIIIAIDQVDTRAMSASAITQLMIKTAKQRRKLTILSDATK